MSNAPEPGSLLAAEICLRDVWPAPVTAELSGWQLRAARGGYNRANSVWTGRFAGDLPVEEAIDRAEDFYRRRNLSPRFQVLRSCEPADLDSRLARRGYGREPDSSSLAKPVAAIAVPANVSIAEHATDEWIGLYGPAQPPEKRAECPDILACVPSPRGFILARSEGVPAAVALVGRVGEDVAVDCVLTRADNRRSGAATAVMNAAEAWAAGQGALRLLLTVVDSNAAAVSLYGKLGYVPLSGYHYRVAVVRQFEICRR